MTLLLFSCYMISNVYILFLFSFFLLTVCNLFQKLSILIFLKHSLFVNIFIYVQTYEDWLLGFSYLNLLWLKKINKYTVIRQNNFMALHIVKL